MRTSTRTALAFQAPFWIGVVALLAVPAALTAGYAFTDHTGLTPPRANGLANVRRALADPQLAASVRATFAYAALAVPLRLVTGIGLGLLLARSTRTSRAARAAVYVPSVTPDIALALVALWLFNPLYGPVNQLLTLVGLPAPVWLDDPWGARLVIALMMTLPISESFLVVLAARRSVPQQEYDSARVDGAGPLQTFLAVTRPRLTPLFALLAVRDVILALQINFVPAYVLTDGGPDSATLFLPLYVFDQAFEFLSFGYGSLLSLLLLLLTASVIGASALVILLLRNVLGRTRRAGGTTR